MSSVSSPSSSVVAPVPVAPIPASVQRLIEKKVSQVALSRFERFSHWFLTKFSCVSPSYEDSLWLANHKANMEKSMAAFQTTHRFFDGTLFLDRTEGRIATISSEDYSIFLQGREVLFSTVGKSQIVIDGYHQIEIIISGLKDQYGVFCITRRVDLVDRDEEHYWIVDTQKKFVRFRPGSAEEETVYVVEEEIQRGIDSNYVQPKAPSISEGSV